MLNNSFETYRRDRGRWYGHNVWLGRKYYNPERRRTRFFPYYYYDRFYDDNEDEYDENICPAGYHYHPENKNSDIYGCMKDSDMIENYDSENIFSKNILIGASILILFFILFYVARK